MGSFGVTKAAQIQAGPRRATQRQSHVPNMGTFPWGSCERIQTELCPLGLQLVVLFLGKAAKWILHSKLPQRCLPVLYFPGVAPLQRKPDWVWLNKSVLTDSWLKYYQAHRWTPGWHNICSRGDKRPAWSCEARCPCPLPWGTQPSVRTRHDLRQRELFSLIEWRPLCISPNQRGTRHHEPLMKQQTPALHLSLGEGRRRPGPPWRIQSPRPSLQGQPWHHCCQSWPMDQKNPATKCIFIEREWWSYVIETSRKGVLFLVDENTFLFLGFFIFASLKGSSWRRFDRVCMCLYTVPQISGEGIMSAMAVLHKQSNCFTLRHLESIPFSTPLQCFLQKQGTVKFF